MSVLDNKSFFIMGGCEFDYVREYLRTNHKAQIQHTFELKSSMNPYDEINNPDSVFYSNKFDYILMSQVQVYKNIFYAINNANKNINVYEEVDVLITQLDESISKINETHRGPIFVMTHPIADLSVNGILSYKYGYSVTEINHIITLRLYELCKKHDNLYMLDFDRIIETSGKNEETVRYEFNGGHPEKKAAELIAKEVGKVLQTIDTKQKKVKCIVFDLDNTLWKGVLREDGLTKIKLHRQRVFSLFSMSKRGIILAVCSKNDPEDAPLLEEALTKYKAFYRDIVVVKMNWQPKSANIEAIARELNIGVDTIAFFDDNEFEREEVRTNLPSVMVYKDTEIVASLAYPEFQNIGEVTKESANRVAFYKAEIERNRMKDTESGSGKSHEDYLRGLGLRLSVSTATADDLNRMEEIFQRTNQQNATMKRMNLSQLQEYYGHADRALLNLELSDKFGEYGMIGAAVVKVSRDAMEIEEFALSCRAMGRKVENTFLLYLINEGIRKRVGSIELKVTKTSRNNQLIQMLKETGFVDTDETSETSTMVYNIARGSDFVPYPDWFAIDVCEIEQTA